jgi:SAM-dependent methyltransferase
LFSTSSNAACLLASALLKASALPGTSKSGRSPVSQEFYTKGFDIRYQCQNDAAMKRTRRAFYLLALAAWCWTVGIPSLRAATSGANTNATSQKPSIPYVPTRHDTVRDLLWMADVSTNDVVYDVGSGDGRVVIAAVRDFHVRQAVGIELDAKLVQESRSNAVAAGVADRVAFIQGDLFTNDFSAASVLVLYLGQRANLDLRPQIIRALKPGARVVSHRFGMGEWIKDKTLDVRTATLGMYGTVANEFRPNPDVPDFDDSPSRRDHDLLSVWIVPAPVAGVWRGKVRADSGDRELRLTLHQRLSGLNGTFQLQGPTNIQGSVEVDLWGDHLRCWCIPADRSLHSDQMWIDGRVKDGNLVGGLRMRQGTNMVEVEWTAPREQADLTGTWEWPGASNAPVQLKLERRNGRLAATYTDKNREKNAWRDDTQSISVFDIYDFGGGFYFTLLLGMESGTYSGGSRRTGPQNGWVVGEAVMEEGTLKGTIAFYPYGSSRLDSVLTRVQPGSKEAQLAALSGRRVWQPKRVAP